ncbi:MAG: hypothetical protein JST54_07495 [Deltaproteobacteria bacterium]|nr:hypothetical protein [Deltaproteobacteria bacterium]
MSAHAWIVLGAPLSAVRRALKAQQAEAIFGPSEKRRVRVFPRVADAAGFTRRNSRARLLAMVEGDARVALAVWRAGVCKVELELPRVLRSSDDVSDAREAIGRLAKPLESDPPGALKPGTAAIDLAAGLCGVGAEQVRAMDFATLVALRGTDARTLDAREQKRLGGLRLLEPDGTESPLVVGLPGPEHDDDEPPRASGRAWNPWDPLVKRKG